MKEALISLLKGIGKLVSKIGKHIGINTSSWNVKYFQKD